MPDLHITAHIGQKLHLSKFFFKIFLTFPNSFKIFCSSNYSQIVTHSAHSHKMFLTLLKLASHLLKKFNSVHLKQSCFHIDLKNLTEQPQVLHKFLFILEESQAKYLWCCGLSVSIDAQKCTFHLILLIFSNILYFWLLTNCHSHCPFS